MSESLPHILPLHRSPRSRWLAPGAACGACVLALAFLMGWMTHQLTAAAAELRAAAEELRKEREASAEQAARQEAASRELLGKFFSAQIKEKP